MVASQTNSISSSSGKSDRESWRSLSDNSLFKRTDFAIAAHQDRYVIIAGGQGERGEELQSVVMYDTHSKSHTILPEIPKRYDCECKGVITNGHFYVVCNGGLMFRLDLSMRSKWEQVHRLLSFKIEYVYETLVQDHLIYILGDDGRRGSGITNKNMVYNTKTNGCATISPMPEYCYDFASAMVGDDIYVIGGKRRTGFSSSVFIFNTISEVWRKAPSLPKKLHSADAAVVGQRWIIVTGGKHGNYDSWCSQTYIFDIHQQRWICNKLGTSEPRLCHGSCSIGRSHVVSVGGQSGGKRRKCSIDIIDRELLIPNWEPLGSLILLRNLFTKGRVCPNHLHQSCARKNRVVAGCDRTVQKVITDLNDDIFREILSFIIE